MKEYLLEIEQVKKRLGIELAADDDKILIKTSITHPLPISWLFPPATTSQKRKHDDDEVVATNKRGNLGLSSVPGKKIRLETLRQTQRMPVYRDLLVDFKHLKYLNIHTVINLLSDLEMSKLQIDSKEYEKAATSQNINILRFPILEGRAPIDMEDFHQEIILPLYDLYKAGHCVLCHCRGGIGRAGMVASCFLLYTKTCQTAEEAMAYVRQRRSPRCIETQEQELFIQDYQDYINNNTITSTTTINKE